MLSTIRKFTVIALLVGTALGTVTAQSPYRHNRSAREAQEAQARRERDIQACSRPWNNAYQQTVKDIKHEKLLADRTAEDEYQSAMHKAKSDAERHAAKLAKRKAQEKAQDAARVAIRQGQEILQKGIETCRNPKQPETNNNPPSNTAEGTLGHGPRGQNHSVRMDLRVVDETGEPVRGVKTKLWSERQSNGLLCETLHTTDARGKVLMDPIHFTKNLQLKLEAKGFEPQMIQVDPSQLDRPFKAVMRATKSY
jgi:hypothetical protein